MKHISPLLLFTLLLFGCAHNENTVTQISTIDALLAGGYDGSEQIGKLKSYGDFGIGTFDRLEGEMIILDGQVYQAKDNGRIYKAERGTTPFASVSLFRPDISMKLGSPVDYRAFEMFADSLIRDDNLFYAIKAEGKFKAMTVRSVPAQSKPYRPLAEVVKTQSVFEYKDIEGTIVGYRLPAYVKGINVAGYHLHFIDSSKTYGGHILAFEMTDGTVSIDKQNRFRMILPERGLEELDLAKDRSDELHRVEKYKAP